MRRLIGGLLLLNLTAISLVLSSGEQSITNEDVLNQLKELRNFIDEKRDFSKGSKDLKPVLVQYRSSASKIDGIVECNLSFHTDALHLSIAGYSVQADGTPITIVINVEYEFTEYVGYTIKTAKINASTGFTNVKVENVKTAVEPIADGLKCGDVVVKVDEAGEHAYIVSYKKDDEMCLTYVDHSIVEEQYFEKTGDDWSWIQEDKTTLGGGGTKLYKHFLHTNDYSFNMTIISVNSTSFNDLSVSSKNSFLESNSYISCSTVFAKSYTPPSTLTIQKATLGSDGIYTFGTAVSHSNITDDVTEL